MLRDRRVRNAPEHSEKIRKVSCGVPFQELQIYDGGEVTNCCYAWMPKILGNVANESLLEIISGKKQKEAQKSVTDGSFSFCDCTICPSLSTYVAKSEVHGPLTSGKIDTTVKALKLYLNYDKSCNLKCPSCRNDFIFFSAKDVPKKLQGVHNSVLASIEELLRHDYFIDVNVTGSGDPFASPLYSRFLAEIMEHPRLSVSLQTNGILMTESRWTPKLCNLLKFVNVSVDAATEDTYNLVRPGGKFLALKKNLALFDDYVKSKKFSKFEGWQINFIVQKDNYQEIPQFLEWALAHKTLSTVWFNLIADWGHLSKSRFNDRAVWHSTHPEHEKFKEILRFDLLKDPRVNLGNMAYFCP